MQQLTLLLLSVLALSGTIMATNFTPVSTVDLSKFSGVWWGYYTSGPNWQANTSMSCWRINFVPQTPRLTAEEHITLSGQTWQVNAYCNITTPQNNFFDCIEEGVPFGWNFFFVNADYTRAMAYNNHFLSLNIYSRDPIISPDDLSRMILIAAQNDFPVVGHTVISKNTNCQAEIEDSDALLI
jgi:Bacterial lipocalin